MNINNNSHQQQNHRFLDSSQSYFENAYHQKDNEEYDSTSERCYLISAIYDPSLLNRMILELNYGTQTFLINNKCPEFTLGRSTHCNLIINHSLTSRNHATIYYDNGKFILSDTSTNGTIINKKQNQRCRILKETYELTGSGDIILGQNDVTHSTKISFKIYTK